MLTPEEERERQRKAWLPLPRVPRGEHPRPLSLPSEQRKTIGVWAISEAGQRRRFPVGGKGSQRRCCPSERPPRDEQKDEILLPRAHRKDTRSWRWLGSPGRWWRTAARNICVQISLSSKGGFACVSLSPHHQVFGGAGKRAPFLRPLSF